MPLDVCEPPEPGVCAAPEPAPEVTPASGLASVYEPPPAPVCEMPRNDWRGTLPDAAREAERGGVKAFTSADRVNDPSPRVVTPGELVRTAERASELLGPGAEPQKVYTLAEDLTIYNTATQRAEYVPLRQRAEPPLACEAPPAPAPPALEDRGVLGWMDEKLGQAHELLQDVKASGVTEWVPGLGSPVPVSKEAREAVKEGIGTAANWLHNRVDDVWRSQADLVLGKDTELGRIYASAQSAPGHLAVDTVAGLANMAFSTPVDLADDLVQSHRGAVRGVETAVDPTKPALERVVGGAEAVVVAAGDVLTVLGGVQMAAAARAPAAAVTTEVTAARVAAPRAPAAAVRMADDVPLPLRDPISKGAGESYREIVSRVPGRVLEEADALTPGRLGADHKGLPGTFSGARYATVQLDEPVTVYRVWAPGQSREFGAMWSLEKPVGSWQARMDLALLPEWGKVPGTPYSLQATEWTAIELPKGTVVHLGEVGSQGGVWSGGARSQLLIEGGPKPTWKVDGGSLQ